MAVIGKPVNRVDGLLKVTGAAKYAAEYNQYCGGQANQHPAAKQRDESETSDVDTHLVLL